MQITPSCSLVKGALGASLASARVGEASRTDARIRQEAAPKVLTFHELPCRPARPDAELEKPPWSCCKVWCRRRRIGAWREIDCLDRETVAVPSWRSEDVPVLYVCMDGQSGAGKVCVVF